jgi:hypothetical protein
LNNADKQEPCRQTLPQLLRQKNIGCWVDLWADFMPAIAGIKPAHNPIHEKPNKTAPALLGYFYFCVSNGGSSVVAVGP